MSKLKIASKNINRHLNTNTQNPILHTKVTSVKPKIGQKSMLLLSCFLFLFLHLFSITLEIPLTY